MLGVHWEHAQRGSGWRILWRDGKSLVPLKLFHQHKGGTISLLPRSVPSVVNSDANHIGHRESQGSVKGACIPLDSPSNSYKRLCRVSQAACRVLAALLALWLRAAGRRRPAAPRACSERALWETVLRGSRSRTSSRARG